MYHRHFEVLLRLEEDGSLIPPGAFLPAAERYNLGPKLDAWVVSRTLEWIADAGTRIPADSIFAINLSGTSVARDEVLEHIVAALRRTGVAPGRVCFEITETAAVGNLTDAVRAMETLRGLGCLFALDDFGSGVSSFAYLKNLPVDFLKIDGLFVKDIVDDAVYREMVRAIHDVGHAMGHRTIAEFVENDAIARVLAGIGVDYVQGYGVGHPVPIDTLLEEQSVRRNVA